MAIYKLDIIAKDQYFISNPGEELPWVQRVAREQWGPKTFIQRHFVDRAFIAFIQQGHGYLKKAKGAAIDITSGSVIYLAGNKATYQLSVKEGHQLHLLILILGNPKGVELAENLAIPHVPVLQLADPGRVEALFYRLLETGSKGGIHSSHIASALVEPILLTINQEFRSHTTAADKVFALFSRCRLYIENNWQALGSVNDVPKLFGISQPYMGKLFRRYEGCTPHQFLLAQKMNFAIYELQAGGSTIESIALELGFSDAYSFSKTFKRVIGKSPSTFRRDV